MKDHDFSCADHGSTATITTSNWTATQWLRDNVQDAEGSVTGANYATIVGEPRYMLDVALGLLGAGFTCANHELLAPRGNA